MSKELGFVYWAHQVAARSGETPCWLEPTSPRESVQTTQENICGLNLRRHRMESGTFKLLEVPLFCSERAGYPDTPLSYTYMSKRARLSYKSKSILSHLMAKES